MDDDETLDDVWDGLLNGNLPPEDVEPTPDTDNEVELEAEVNEAEVVTEDATGDLQETQIPTAIVTEIAVDDASAVENVDEINVAGDEELPPTLDTGDDASPQLDFAESGDGTPDPEVAMEDFQETEIAPDDDGLPELSADENDPNPDDLTSLDMVTPLSMRDYGATEDSGPRRMGAGFATDDVSIDATPDMSSPNQDYAESPRLNVDVSLTDADNLAESLASQIRPQLANLSEGLFIHSSRAIEDANNNLDRMNW